MKKKINEVLAQLKKSSFRRRFKLKKQEKEYVVSKGLDVIKQHAYDFVRNRLAPAEIPNDGNQTPMRGHPVFIAQHATATCCRHCLFQFHKIQPGRELTQEEIDYVVAVIMAWIEENLEEA